MSLNLGQKRCINSILADIYVNSASYYTIELYNMNNNKVNAPPRSADIS
jgi:hypothetical protein